MVRAKVPPLGLVEPTRKEIHAVDPEQPVSNISTMNQMIADLLGVLFALAGSLAVTRRSGQSAF